MLKVQGKVQNVIKKTITRKDGTTVLDRDTGQPLEVTEIQIIQKSTLGKLYVLNIQDNQNREWKVGEQEIPVYVAPFTRGNGKAGYSLRAA